MTRLASPAPFECPREHEVFDAVALGRWPGVDGDLAAHVAGCAICRDLADVAGALHDDGAAAMREAQPPGAAAVWWRATIRARADAARTAMKPIGVLQGIAGACVAGATAALATIGWQSVDGADRIGALVSRFATDQGAATSGFTVAHVFVLVVGLAACLVLAPVALYLTLAGNAEK
jgi:hypothetical protein